MMTMTQEKPDVIFNKGLFSSVFWRIREALTRFVVVYGGASASKSYSLMQHIVISTFEETSNWLCIRKYSTDIQNSIYDNLIGIINEWNLGNQFQFRLSPLSITNKLTGSKIIFKGLDDTEKIKSIYGIKRIFIEEANQLEFDDFRELNRRARGMDGIQIYLVFNPVVINHWLKRELFDNPFYEPHTTKIHATYKDAIKWLTEDDILQLEILKDINPNDYKIYTLGEWGGVRTGNEFYYNFVYTKHIGKCDVQKDKALHISFDQNVVPYITMTIWQISQEEDVYYVNCIDELCLKNPLNNTESLCRKFAEKYEDYLEAGLFYYGDASGRKRDTRANENDYEIVERILHKWLSNSSCRVPYNNPLVKKRRDFANRILSNKYNIRLQIDKNCQNVITDLEMVQEDAEGKKFKKKKSEHGGTAYEEYGHTSDTMDYLLMSAFENYIELI
jgi:phage terminase large subunit